MVPNKNKKGDKHQWIVANALLSKLTVPVSTNVVCKRFVNTNHLNRFVFKHMCWSRRNINLLGLVAII